MRIRGTYGVKIPKHKAKRLKLQKPSEHMMKLYRKAVSKHIEHCTVSFMGRGHDVEMLQDHFEASVQNAETRFLNAIHDLEVEIAQLERSQK